MKKLKHKKTKIKSLRDQPRYLDFKSKKLIDEARQYQHEVSHLTSDLKSINERAQRCLAICKYVINTLGNSKKSYRLNWDVDFENFEDLSYHIENFIFRLHAYRDKLSMFINLTFRLGYDSSEMGVFDKLINNGQIIKFTIDTELRKMKADKEVADLMNRRKLMSHKVYYCKGVGSLFPDVSPQEVGIKKAAQQWRTKVITEAEKIDSCLVKIFEINEKITNKIKKYLSNN